MSIPDKKEITILEYDKYQTSLTNYNYAWTEKTCEHIAKVLKDSFGLFDIDETPIVYGYKGIVEKVDPEDDEEKPFYANIFIAYAKKENEITKLIMAIMRPNKTNTNSDANGTVYSGPADMAIFNSMIAVNKYINTVESATKFSFLDGKLKMEMIDETKYKLTIPGKSEGFYGKKLDFFEDGTTEFNISAEDGIYTNQING